MHSKVNFRFLDRKLFVMYLVIKNSMVYVVGAAEMGGQGGICQPKFLRNISKVTKKT